MNTRIILLLAAVIASIILIGPNPFASGSVVTSSKIPQIAAGDIIYKINGEDINLNKDFSGNVKIETNKGTKFVKTDGRLNITVQDVPKTNLKFGLDINGGTRALVKVNDSNALEQTLQTLQNRISLFGLRESTFRPVDKNYIEISIAGGTKDELSELLGKQGKFEAKIPVVIRLRNGTGEITLDKKYEAIAESGKVRIGDKLAGENETIQIATIPFKVNRLSQNSVNLTSTVFTGDDIKLVFLDPQRNRVERADGGYRWMFSVQLSNEGAQRFAWVTRNIPASLDYLESQIYLYLDDKLIDALNIATNLKGKVETEISITGGSPTQQDAIKEKSKIQSILRAGALPTTIEVAQLDTISPNLGRAFLYNAAIAALAAVGGVTVVVTLRYRKPKLIIPMVVVSLSEVIIVLGITAGRVTIDLPFIAGIIATIGTGIDAQIIMMDEALRKEARIETLREKLARAFFIIFGSAGTIIAAMLPLLVLGFGLLQGFAIVTIIGVLSGIAITRPAFGAIIEKLVKV